MIVSGMTPNVKSKLVLLLPLIKILLNYVLVGYLLVQQRTPTNARDMCVKNMNLQLIPNAKQPCPLVLLMVLNVSKEDRVQQPQVKQDVQSQSKKNNVIG